MNRRGPQGRASFCQGLRRPPLGALVLVLVRSKCPKTPSTSSVLVARYLGLPFFLRLSLFCFLLLFFFRSSARRVCRETPGFAFFFFFFAEETPPQFLQIWNFLWRKAVKVHVLKTNPETRDPLSQT